MCAVLYGKAEKEEDGVHMHALHTHAQDISTVVRHHSLLLFC
jgi:hypothetical protein